MGHYASEMQSGCSCDDEPRQQIERYVHVKTNGVYDIVCRGRMECDGTDVIVYRNINTNEVWVRPAREFLDGRFVEQDTGFPELWKK